MHPPQVEGRAGAVGTLGGRFPDRDDLRQQVVGILPATTVKMAINQGREIGATREQVRAHLELRSPQFPRPGQWSKATVESIPGFEAAAGGPVQCKHGDRRFGKHRTTRHLLSPP
jgi:hypothetical protein